MCGRETRLLQPLTMLLPPQRALSDLEVGEGLRSSGMVSPLAW